MFYSIFINNRTGGSMTALNPLNPQSAKSASINRPKHKRKAIKSGNASSNNLGSSKISRISPGNRSAGTTSQLSSPSIHVTGLPHVVPESQQQRLPHVPTPPRLASAASKSTLDDIDDFDNTSDTLRLTNGHTPSSKLLHIRHCLSQQLLG